MEVYIMVLGGAGDGIAEFLLCIFGAVGGIFASVVLILGVAFVLLMKYNAYGYGIKKFIDNKGNKQWQFWVILFAQIIHIFIMTVFSILSTVLFGVCIGILANII